MGLFEGRKRWLFCSEDQTHLLYPQTHSGSLDLTFAPDFSRLPLPPPSANAALASASAPTSVPSSAAAEAGESELDRYPLLCHLQLQECILEAGEILFVPSGPALFSALFFLIVVCCCVLAHPSICRQPALRRELDAHFGHFCQLHRLHQLSRRHHRTARAVRAGS